MPNNVLLQIQPLAVDPLTVQASAAPEASVREGAGMLCGIDVGSTTCKYVLASASGEVLAQAYERHNTKQGEKVLDFLSCLESEHGLTPERDRIFFTGSGAGIIAPLVGGKIIQEVVAVSRPLPAWRSGQRRLCHHERHHTSKPDLDHHHRDHQHDRNPSIDSDHKPELIR